MERNNYIKRKLMDAINCSVHNNFTQMPNLLLRNPNISSKAKIILGILLSNKDGWKSYNSNLEKSMKEGKDAIQTGLQELEWFKYLMRIRFKDKRTKQMKGSFWAYTDTPGQFNIEQHLELLDQNGFEIHIQKNPRPVTPDPGNPDQEIPPLIIYNNKDKNINGKNISSTGGSNHLTTKAPNGNEIDFVTEGMFDKFWEMYPNKKGKGFSFSSWVKLCRKGNKRPTWIQIKQAVKEQIKSDRWQDPQYIPLASTWINQNRWLDDPKGLVSYAMKGIADKRHPKFVIEHGRKWFLNEDDGRYYDSEGELLI